MSQILSDDIEDAGVYWILSSPVRYVLSRPRINNTNAPFVQYCTPSRKRSLQCERFHADPHPGNLIKTENGELAILDFGENVNRKGRKYAGLELYLTLSTTFNPPPPPATLSLKNHSGLVATLKDSERANLKSAVKHLLTGQYSKLVKEDSVALGFLNGDADMESREPRITKLLRRG